MYPHERSLVIKHKDDPFALIGINSDATVERARLAVEKNNLNWRSFYQGSPRSPDAISTKWNVKSWPTIILIDHEGRIRYRGNTLDDALLEKLINAAKAPK